MRTGARSLRERVEQVRWDLAEDYHDGTHVGVFLRVPRGLKELFPPQEDNPTPPHVTVVYFGEVGMANKARMAQVVSDVVKNFEPFHVMLEPRVSYFTPSESSEGRQVAKLAVWDMSSDFGQLDKLHHEIWQACEKAGIHSKSVFNDDYKPHATLRYLEPHEKEYTWPIPEGHWLVDGVEVWGFDEPVAIPFG